MQDKLKPDADFSGPQRPAIYVHVPFCAKPCAYCRFYKRRPTLGDAEAYVSALEAEAGRFFGAHPGLEPSSVFFGGGTPTSLGEKHLERLCKIFSRFDSVEEWTVEASPSTANRGKLEALRGMGPDRLSLGVQSFDAQTLESLGRGHSPKAALQAIEDGLAVFDNMNIDLIFGGPGQTAEMWRKDLEKAASHPLSHISAYCLEFESATSCCAGLEKPMPDQEREAAFLETAIETLEARGFRHYEISNYAKPGRECLQNVNTWRMGSWVGFGPSAASQFGGLRFQNCADLDKWAKGVESGSPELENVVRLDDDELYSSALIFGLRMRSGVNLEHLKKRFPNADAAKYGAAAAAMVEEGLLSRDGPLLSLTRKGIPLADAVAVEFL